MAESMVNNNSNISKNIFLNVMTSSVIKLKKYINSHFYNLLISFIIVIIGYIIANIFYKKLKNNEQYKNRLQYSILNSIIYYGIILISVLFALLNAELSTRVVFIALGSLSLAISFGINLTIQKLIGSIIIVYKKKFKYNDIIKVGDVTGYVSSFNILHTTVTDTAGIKTHIPNNKILDDNFINITKDDKIILETYIGISNNTYLDFNRLSNYIIKAVSKSPYVLNNDVSVSIYTISINTTQLLVMTPIYSKDYFDAKVSINRILYSLLKNTSYLKHNISIT